MILEKIARNVEHFSDRTAVTSLQGQLSYGSLWDLSDRLAGWLEEKLGEDKSPVVVYGHKSPWMLVCFFACVKSGRAYCPVDISMAEERVNAIVKAVDTPIVLATEPLMLKDYQVVQQPGIEQAAEESMPIGKEKWLKPDDIYYIIFTSGSTGEPKGVQISCSNLENYTDWSVTLGDGSEKKRGGVFLNQAPFSFDLSVMDLYTCMVSAGTLYCVEKTIQKDMGMLMDYLRQSDISYWVSTPSFADMCLTELGFNEELMPQMRVFLFCGEKLTNDTAAKLYERFPRAQVVNTYGPTESTVAVTQTIVTSEMINRKEPLPIGVAKSGTEIKILAEDGTEVAEGQKGEIVIFGDTVSPGYFKNPEKTNKAFGVDENGIRFYRTGDEGYKINDMIHYSGRIDLQVKFHGYRIELGDIEANLMQLPQVTGAAVVPQIAEDGKIRYLAAFVTGEKNQGTFEDRKAIRVALKNRLPEYMVPKKVVFLDQLPMTSNGKTDRKKLEEYL